MSTWIDNMYRIQGLKSSGREVDKTYEDIKEARFVFECMQLNNISKYIVLYEVCDTKMNQVDIFIN